MIFNSVKEYFYKMQSYCFMLLLIPVCFLCLIHFKRLFADFQPILFPANVKWVVGISLLILLFSLTIVHWCAAVKLKKLFKEFGLGVKLDGYFIITLLRFSLGVICCFFIAAVFILTRIDLLNGFFFLVLLWMMFQLPTPRKVCSELRLKGDEREMVLFKKDKF